MADTIGFGSLTPSALAANPYLQQIIDQTSRGTVDNFNRTVVPAQNTAMARSGSFGNSGLQEMARADAEGLRTSLSDAEAKLRYTDYSNQMAQANIDRTFGEGVRQADRSFGEGARQFDEGTRRYEQNFGRDTFNDAFGQQQTGFNNGLNLIQLMAGMNGSDVANSTTVQNTPLSYLGQFSQVGSQIGGQGGSATTTAGTTSNPALSALGGAQLGRAAADWWGSSGGYAASPASSSTVGWSTSPAWDSWATGTGGMGG